MRILHSFDTRLMINLYKEAVNEYGLDSVFLIKRCRVFYYFKIIIPLIILIFMMGLTSTLFAIFRDIFNLYGNKYILAIDAIVVLFWFFTIGGQIIKQYIDYKMDYAIITPDEISAYNQTGLFSRSVRTIESRSVKTITMPKTNFIQSFFNYGTLVFLAETSHTVKSKHDAEVIKGHIKFHYVSNPELTKKKVLRILESRRK